MKKTLSIVLVAMLTLILCNSVVFANADLKVALSANNAKVKVGEEVEVAISLKNVSSTEGGVSGIAARLEYDTAVFEALEEHDTDIRVLTGWDSITYSPASGIMATVSPQYMVEDQDLITIKFKVKEDAKLGDTIVAVKDIQVAGINNNEYYPSDQQINLTIQEKTSENNITVNNVVPDENKADKNPSTGIEDFTVPAILVVSVLGIITYVRYRNLEK